MKSECLFQKVGAKAHPCSRAFVVFAKAWTPKLTRSGGDLRDGMIPAGGLFLTKFYAGTAGRDDRAKVVMKASFSSFFFFVCHPFLLGDESPYLFTVPIIIPP